MIDQELLQTAIDIKKWTGLLADLSLFIGAFCIGYLYGGKP